MPIYHRYQKRIIAAIAIGLVVAVNDSKAYIHTITDVNAHHRIHNHSGMLTEKAFDSIDDALNAIDDALLEIG